MQNLGPDSAKPDKVISEEASGVMHAMLIGFFFKEIQAANKLLNDLVKRQAAKPGSFDLEEIGAGCNEARAMIFKALKSYDDGYKSMVEK